MSSAVAPQAPSALVIRPFIFPDDYAAVIQLWENAGPGIHVGRSDQADEIRKKLARDPDLFLVAEEGGEVVGTVLGGFDGRRGMMYHLAVRPECRRRGIATQLVEELERRLIAKGCLRAYLLVKSDNLEAMRFYEKRGWERMEVYVYGKDLVTEVSAPEQGEVSR